MDVGRSTRRSRQGISDQVVVQYRYASYDYRFPAHGVH
nr:MAG TPA: hypothetical protein [Caudoviricetes sp.]